MVNAKPIQPTLSERSYNCPRCGVLCPQEHYIVGLELRGEYTHLATTRSDDPLYDDPYHFENAKVFVQLPESYDGPEIPYPTNEWNLVVSVCSECEQYTIWNQGKMIYPFDTELPEAHPDMPSNVKQIYGEASLVYKHSPRASAALLRLAIETMIPQLEYDIKKGILNEMIGELVKKDIPEHVQQGLDSIRVYGNEGIHPGEIDLNDDQDTVMFLFELINIMVEELIARKEKINAFYRKLPRGKLKGIEKRDTDKSKS